MISPQPLQIKSAPTEHLVVMPIEQSTIPTHQQEGGEEIEEDIELDNLEYAMTKENLKEIEKEIAASRKREGEASPYLVRIRRRRRVVGYCCRHHRRRCSKQNINRDTI